MKPGHSIPHGGRQLTVHNFDTGFMHSPMSTELVRAYQDIFGAGPWYEQYRCIGCPAEEAGRDRQYPFYTKDVTGTTRLLRALPADLICLACNKPLVPFWPEERVRSEVLHELSLPGACGLVLSYEGSVIGFCIGFCAAPEFLEDHLGLPGMATVITGISQIQKLAYLSDIAVIPTERKKGLARLMFMERDKQLQVHRPDGRIFRSRPDAITYQWYTAQFGFSIVDRYDRMYAEDVRVILMLTNNA